MEAIDDVNDMKIPYLSSDDCREERQRVWTKSWEHRLLWHDDDDDDDATKFQKAWKLNRKYLRSGYECKTSPYCCGENARNTTVRYVEEL